MSSVTVYKIFVSPGGIVHRVDFCGPAGTNLSGWHGMNGCGNALQGDVPHLVSIRANAAVSPNGVAYLIDPDLVDRMIHEALCECHFARVGEER